MTKKKSNAGRKKIILDEKEAAKLVLMYSSIYAKVQEEGLYKFLNDELLKDVN